MSKKNSRSTILPPLQRRVILCLAQEGLQTINEVVKNIPRLELAPASHYKPTWLAIKSLTNNGYIQTVEAKEYRGRKYPQYWLTGNGILLALIEGSHLTHLLTETQRIYPDNTTYACYLEIASKLDPGMFRIAFSALDIKGKVETIDIITMIVTQTLTDQTVQEIIAILKAYPQEYQLFKKRIEKMYEDLNMFIDSL